jgi:hypothetical protein
MKMMKILQKLRTLVACGVISFMSFHTAEAKQVHGHQTETSSHNVMEVASQLAAVLHMPPLKGTWTEDRIERKQLAKAVGMNPHTYAGKRLQNKYFAKKAQEKITELAKKALEVPAPTQVADNTQAQSADKSDLPQQPSATDSSSIPVTTSASTPNSIQQTLVLMTSSPSPTPTPENTPVAEATKTTIASVSEVSQTNVSPSPLEKPLVTEKPLAQIRSEPLASRASAVKHKVHNKMSVSMRLILAFLLMCLVAVFFVPWALTIIKSRKEKGKQSTPTSLDEAFLESSLPPDDEEFILPANMPATTASLPRRSTAGSNEKKSSHQIATETVTRQQEIKALKGSVPFKRLTDLCENVEDLQVAARHCTKIELKSGAVGKDALLRFATAAKVEVDHLQKDMWPLYSPRPDDYDKLKGFLAAGSFPRDFQQFFMILVFKAAVKTTAKEKPEYLPMLQELAVSTLDIPVAIVREIMPAPKAELAEV